MHIRMNIRPFIALSAVFTLFFLSACTYKPAEKAKEEDIASAEGSYHKIDADKAKQMIDKEQAVTIVDVRSKEEFDSGHLPDALLVPLETIGDEMPESLPDKDALLIVYCRSGRRSKEASDKLAAMGYLNIYDMGGIIDWTYDTDSED